MALSASPECPFVRLRARLYVCVLSMNPGGGTNVPLRSSGTDGRTGRVGDGLGALRLQCGLRHVAPRPPFIPATRPLPVGAFFFFLLSFQNRSWPRLQANISGFSFLFFFGLFANTNAKKLDKRRGDREAEIH